MRIAHNLMAMNNSRMLGINDKKKIGSAEKLSSGYKINRAADDAAGLAISEKMRRLIRGLDKGTENARDGVSWTQSGDGALNEVHDILHRMTELTVKALNETNTADDRMAMEMEFEQLQSELDRIADTTTFNEIPIFSKHEVPYYQCEGAAKWNPQQMHVVTAGENDLNFEYRVKEDEPPKTVSITVPPGSYTTQELVDEIETLLSEKNTGDEKLVFEFTPEGYCNANLEGGQVIDKLSGGLTYLVYEMYKGGSYGALIGTTSFPSEYSKLNVVTGQNNYMEFTIEDFEGNSTLKSINIPQGRYNRSELIDLLNGQLQDTTVRATAYGDGIKLSSDDAMVTGFKGNMFKIDGSGTIYNSVFYDNVKYGSVVQKAGYFTGGQVLPTDSRDEEHRYYRIDSSNNTLTLRLDGSGTDVTITIPEDDYTAEQMAAKLNDLFAAQGVNATATKIPGYSSTYEGLQITSGTKGLESKVEIDSNSSAYKTLFVTREYNSYGGKATLSNETTANKEATFSGSKDLSGISATTPLSITAGVNDSFELTLTSLKSDGTEETQTYTITMDATKTYDSAQDVADELDRQLNGDPALAGYKGKVTVSLVSNKIVLTGSTGENVNKIRVGASAGKDVFDSIFQGYTTTTSTPDASGKGEVVLNTPYDGTLDSGETNLTIKVDGKEYTVDLSQTNGDKDKIIEAINTQIPGYTQTTDNTFSTVTDTGGVISHHFTEEKAGTTSSPYWGSSATGSAREEEGVVGLLDSKPATLTLGPTLQKSMVVTSSNNTIYLQLNGVPKTITLDNGTYDSTKLKNELQKKIDNAFGTGMGGAIVDVKNNKLVLTSRLPEGEDGRLTNISCNTNTSSFLRELNTTRTAAVWTSDNQLASSVTIDATNGEFTFRYSEGGNTQNVTLQLSPGSYDRDSLVAEINRQLDKTSTGIEASLSDGKLVMTSTAKGSDVKIYYKTQTGGSSAEAIFGPLEEQTAAQVEVGLRAQDSITINQGDTFTIHVNGVDQTVAMDALTNADLATVVAKLNEKLAEANAGVEVFTYDTNKLGYRTTATGTSASLSVSYTGNVMKAIYGSTTREYAGVKASFDGDNKLKLTAVKGDGTTNNNSTITVPISGGSAFQQAEVSKTPISTSYADGYHSAKNSYIDGVSLSGDVTIDEWNNTLKFTFKDNGTDKAVSIEIPAQVPAKAYTYDELKTELQDRLDVAVGTGKIEVTVNADGVRLEVANTGSNYQFSNFSGDFYDKVMCSCTEQSRDQNVSSKVGTQTTDGAYTVGRKSVRGGGIDIREDISDELILDLTYGGTVHEISVTLDPGKYTGDELVDEIQEKINEQLKGMGLAENLIEVGIGGINTGVHGANDQNALNFSLSKTVTSPAEGQFIIDGVRGNAAFEIFYQTDGIMQPAYIMGTKDVSNGVTVPAGETDLSLTVDGVAYTIDLEAKEYTTEEILDAMNEKLEAAGAPVSAELEDNKIKLSHKKLGEHEIDDIHGGARENIFFQENGQKTPDAARYVKLSSEDGDSIGLKRHVLSSAFMGLNSCCISQIKNAEKALVRLEQASRIVSNIRSDFGSTQNRLEHAINSNENKAENLQNAESVIRDTDMAEEMLKYSNANIISQAAQSMLAQANQSQQGVLSLLS